MKNIIYQQKYYLYKKKYKDLLNQMAGSEFDKFDTCEKCDETYEKDYIQKFNDKKYCNVCHYLKGFILLCNYCEEEINPEHKTTQLFPPLCKKCIDKQNNIDFGETKLNDDLIISLYEKCYNEIVKRKLNAIEEKVQRIYYSVSNDEDKFGFSIPSIHISTDADADDFIIIDKKQQNVFIPKNIEIELIKIKNK